MESQLARIMEQLIRDKHLTQKELQKAVNRSVELDKALEQVLVDSGEVSRAEYLDALAKVTGVPSIDVRNEKIHFSTAQIVPQSMAQRFKMLCLKRHEGRIVVAMMDPHDTFAIEYAKMRTGYEVDPQGAYLPDLLEAIDHAYSVTVEHITAETQTGAAETSRAKEGEESRFVVATPTPARVRQAEMLWRDLASQQPPRTITLGRSAFKMSVPASGSDEASALRALVEVGSELSATLDSDSLIHKILQISMDLTQSEACSLILIGDERNYLYFKGAIGAKAEEVLRVRFPFDEHSVAGYSIKHRKTMRINDTNRDPRHNKDVDKAVEFRTRSLLCIPVLWMGEPLGVIEAVNKKDNQQFTDADQKYLEILASQAAVALNNAVVVGRLQNFYHEAVELLIDTLEASDAISRNHLVEVARFASDMGRHLHLSEPEMERLTYAGLLHDIGKIRVSDPDDPAHAEWGAQILSRVKIFEDVAPIVRHHHEHYDGSGSPGGLKGEAIPHLARLLAIAEAWVEELAKVGPEGRRQLLEDIRARFRSQFDPDLRQAFECAVEASSPVRQGAGAP